MLMETDHSAVSYHDKLSIQLDVYFELNGGLKA
jgi:hypothetical protein